MNFYNNYKKEANNEVETHTLMPILDATSLGRAFYPYTCSGSVTASIHVMQSQDKPHYLGMNQNLLFISSPDDSGALYSLQSVGVHWNHLESFTKQGFLRPTPKDSDLIGLGKEGPGHLDFKGSLVIVTCSEFENPDFGMHPFSS